MSFQYHYVLPPTGAAENQTVREMFDDIALYINSVVPSGGAAPYNAQYLTLATDPTLTLERVLTAGTGIGFTDNGAGSTLVVANTGVLSLSTTNVNSSFSTSTGAITFSFSPTPTFSSLIFQSATGAIGITPSASAFTSYNLTLPLNTGTNGYVLTTDGATPTATLTWASTGVKAITGTVNQISVDSTGDPIVISAAQDIATSSSPTFSQVKLTGGTSGSDVTLKFDDDNNGFLGGTGLSTKLYIAGSLVTTWTSALLLDNAGVVRGSNLQMRNGSGNILTFTPNGSFSDYTLTWPADDGTPNQFLQTNGSGTLTWADFSSLGATKALDNLASVAINTSLLPGTTSSIDLGSTSKKWLNVYTTGVVSITGNLSFTETGGGTDTITIEAPSSVTVGYALKLPGTQGGSNTFLKNDGSGNLTWSSTTAAGAATTALDNLASVAINTNLLPGIDNSIDLGNSTHDWRSLYVSTSIKNGATTLATATELGYLTGVTSAIQTQLDSKAVKALSNLASVAINATLVGDTTNTYDLGTSSISWRRLYIGDGSVSSPSITFTTDPDTGIYRIGADDLGIACNGQKQADISATGIDLNYAGTAFFKIRSNGTSLKGTDTNTAQPAGWVGEVISSTVSTFGNCSSTNTYSNITSIALTKGNWLIFGSVEFALNAATMTRTSMAISVNSGNTTTDQVDGLNDLGGPVPATAQVNPGVSLTYYLSLAADTTVYLKGRATFSAGTPQQLGSIQAIRTS